jgi:alkylhydroperoxidase/carboxymuconolactone decarboxylase family protein YurZ
LQLQLRIQRDALIVCIDIHTKAAKNVGVTKEELAESILVSTALKAGSALAHSVNELNAYDA